MGRFLTFDEDGNGIINKIQRVAIQGLTKGIQGLQVTIEFLSFFFKDAWEGMKRVASGTGDIIAGSFQWLGAQIKKFANNVLLQIARIPILGSGIDKAAARRRVREAADAVDEAEKKIREGRNKLAEQAVMDATFMARFRKEQEGKAIAQQEKKNQEMLDEIQAEQDKKDEEDRKKKEKERENHLKKLANLEKKYLQADQDLQDKTALEKAQRKRERAQAELDALKLSEKKKKYTNALNTYYDNLEKEAKQKDKEKEDAEKQKQDEKDAKDLEDKRKKDKKNLR